MREFDILVNWYLCLDYGYKITLFFGFITVILVTEKVINLYKQRLDFDIDKYSKYLKVLSVIVIMYLSIFMVLTVSAKIDLYNKNKSLSAMNTGDQMPVITEYSSYLSGKCSSVDKYFDDIAGKFRTDEENYIIFKSRDYDYKKLQNNYASIMSESYFGEFMPKIESYSKSIGKSEEFIDTGYRSIAVNWLCGDGVGMYDYKTCAGEGVDFEFDIRLYPDGKVTSRERNEYNDIIIEHFNNSIRQPIEYDVEGTMTDISIRWYVSGDFSQLAYNYSNIDSDDGEYIHVNTKREYDDDILYYMAMIILVLLLLWFFIRLVIIPVKNFLVKER